MSDLLFAVPWWIPTLLAVIGIALFINGNKTQVDKLRNAGVGVIALAILWALLSYFVDTDKEKVEKGMEQVVQAAVDGEANGDWSKFKSYLMPRVAFGMRGGSPSNSEEVTKIAQNGAAAVKLKSATLRNVEIKQTGPLITVHCDIFSTQDSFAPMETSTWQFDWEQTNTGWKIREIDLLGIKDIPNDQLDGAWLRAKGR